MSDACWTIMAAPFLEGRYFFVDSLATSFGGSRPIAAQNSRKLCYKSTANAAFLGNFNHC
jgi:hypothetical protein